MVIFCAAVSLFCASPWTSALTVRNISTGFMYRVNQETSLTGGHQHIHNVDCHYYCFTWRILINYSLMQQHPKVESRFVLHWLLYYFYKPDHLVMSSHSGLQVELNIFNASRPLLVNSGQANSNSPIQKFGSPISFCADQFYLVLYFTWTMYI